MTVTHAAPSLAWPTGAMAEAKIGGQTYAPTHKVWRKDENGQRVQVEFQAFDDGELNLPMFRPVAG